MTLRPDLYTTLRVKAFRIPKEAYPDPEDTVPSSSIATVRSRAVDRNAPTVVIRRDRFTRLLTFQIWGVAALLVAVLAVLFR